MAGNEQADYEAKHAANAHGLQSREDRLHYKDYYPLYRIAISNQWQEEWLTGQTNSFTRMIKNTIKPWSSSNNQCRKTEVTLFRLRAGHTRLTHSYLIEKRPQPLCTDCFVHLTVKHILAECPSWREERFRIFPQTRGLSTDETLKLMLTEPERGTYSPNPLMNYLQQLDLLQHI